MRRVLIPMAAAILISATASAQVPSFDRVFVIVMENKEYGSVIGSSSAPYENALATECGLAGNYHGVTHPSLPNYIAATSGGTQGISDDCGPSECPRRVQSLFGQLQAAGMTWTAYDESMPAPCSLSDDSGTNPPGIRLPDTRCKPVTCPSEPSNEVELTPKIRSPPSSCAAEIRSISG